MKRFFDQKIKKKLFYIIAAALVVVFAAGSAFAQEIPTDAPAIEGPAESDAPSADPTSAPTPSAEPTATPTPSAAPTEESVIPAEPTAAPMPSEEPTIAPTPTAEPSAPEPAAESTLTPEPPEAPTVEQKEAEPVYGAPAVFLNQIAAKGGDDTLRLTEIQLADIEKQLPQTLSAYRREVVMQAYSLVGKVNYFWGGKSTATGWDVRWKNKAIVGSAGSAQTGTVRAYGLDCSGYVLWSFVNAEECLAARGAIGIMEKPDVINRVGYGTAGQWALSTEIAWEQAQPGDLVFYGPPATTPRNHVGIVVGTDEQGQLLVAHCSSANNDVVVSEAREAGFQYVRALDLTAQREAGFAAVDTDTTLPNGLPLVLTEEQTYEAAAQNGWAIAE